MKDCTKVSLQVQTCWYFSHCPLQSGRGKFRPKEIVEEPAPGKPHGSSMLAKNLILQCYPPVLPRAEIPLPEDAPPDCSPRSVLGMHATSHTRHIKTSSRVLEAHLGDTPAGPILQHQKKNNAETCCILHHVVLVTLLGASNCALSATA